MWRRWQSHIDTPTSGASLAAFRVLFGLLLCVSTLRFISNGWIERVYDQPTFHFLYWGFEWVRPFSHNVMLTLYIALAMLALFIALGFLYRISAALFFAIFTYVELVDVAVYLNHYYLVSLIALWLCVVPAHSNFSLDARLFGWGKPVRLWHVYGLRFQFGVVYFFAGLAKFQTDWLVYAQPLGIWTASRTETPWIGALLGETWAPHLMSWAGFLNDLLAAPLLLWKRSRLWAYLMIVLFHTGTAILFPIGIFPYLMMIGATLFFSEQWPYRWFSRQPVPVPAVGQSTPRWVLLVMACFCAMQVLIPLRSHLYGGNVLWHEQGMRYAWRVMVRAKTGSVEYRVRSTKLGKQIIVSPRNYLNNHQSREMSGQPDLILQLAHHIAEDYRERGHVDVEVRADALASLNGRRAARLIDPNVDLAAVTDSLMPKPWISPAPAGPPLLVGAMR